MVDAVNGRSGSRAGCAQPQRNEANQDGAMCRRLYLPGTERSAVELSVPRESLCLLLGLVGDHERDLVLLDARVEDLVVE
jgi:hypothetical protein